MTDQVIETPVNETPVETPVVQDTPVAVEPTVAEQAPAIEEGLKGLLGDEMKSVYDELKPLHTFKSVDDLAKSYVHLNKLMGKKITDMSPEEINQVYGKLGKPENADGYELPTEGLEGAILPDMDKWYKEVAHKHNLTKEQARGIFEEYVQMSQGLVQNQTAQLTQAREEAITALKKEFGTAFENRLEVAKKAVNEFGGDELKTYLNETGLGNDPRLIKAFAKIGAELLEDRMISDKAAHVMGVTPDEAKRQISMKMADNEFKSAYLSRMHPGHKEAVAEMTRLQELAHPK